MCRVVKADHIWIEEIRLLDPALHRACPGGSMTGQLIQGICSSATDSEEIV
jgi:hypothetical protein